MRALFIIALIVGLGGLVGCAKQPAHPVVIEPPVMSQRELGKPPTTAEIPGEQVAMSDEGVPFVLYIPHGYTPTESGAEVLTVHFHGAPWFVIQEHLRRGLNSPLVCFALGEGSSVYRRPFEDGDRLDRVMGLVEKELSHRTGKHITIIALDITSFSAGYGAVREIVRSPKYLDIMRRVVLCDSMYASWDPATTQPGATSRPLDEQIDVWMSLAKRAEAGQLAFVFTYSQVPTPYANSAACAHAIAREMKMHFETGTGPAAADPHFPLIERADAGHLHLWGYGGTDGAAHLAHVRHLADVWHTLDLMGE